LEVEGYGENNIKMDIKKREDLNLSEGAIYGSESVGSATKCLLIKVRPCHKRHCSFCAFVTRRLEHDFRCTAQKH